MERTGQTLDFSGRQKLIAGANYFWISYTLKDDADIDHRLDAGCERVNIAAGPIIRPRVTNPEGSQRLGIALRKRGKQDTVGILYEGSQAHMTFQRIKLGDTQLFTPMLWLIKDGTALNLSSEFSNNTRAQL